MTFKVDCMLKSQQPGTKPVIATFQLTYPRAILHEEFMTHRALSRNATSSRATPVSTMIKNIQLDPAIPSVWGVEKKGMSDGGAMSEEGAKEARRLFLKARDNAILVCSDMLRAKECPHKQILNLLLRPWEHITVVTTATEWANFFALRTDLGAKPEFQILSNMMWQAYKEKPTQLLKPGEWHLPYIYDHEIDTMLLSKDKDAALTNLIKVSAARCARTSYKNFRGKVVTFEEEMALYERLMGSHPLHASPTEHQATPDTSRVIMQGNKVVRQWDHPHLHGNFVGFQQYRKMLPGENITVFNPPEPEVQAAEEEAA